jgi:uncharacterized protein with HEPN domain
MTRSSSDFLKHIIACGEKAVATFDTHPTSAFHRFSDVGMVLMLCLEIIGEATKNDPPEIKKRHLDKLLGTSGC